MKTLTLDISSVSQEFDKIFIADIKRAANFTIEMYATVKPVSISILICDDGYIKNLNISYRGIDKATDVLSFPSDYMLPDSNVTFLGDIAISYPAAVIQAEKALHPIAHELVLLTVHGILHLLGYDHTTVEEEKEMWDLQRKIFDSLGYNIDLLTGESYAQE